MRDAVVEAAACDVVHDVQKGLQFEMHLQVSLCMSMYVCVCVPMDLKREAAVAAAANGQNRTQEKGREEKG